MVAHRPRTHSITPSAAQLYNTIQYNTIALIVKAQSSANKGTSTRPQRFIPSPDYRPTFLPYHTPHVSSAPAPLLAVKTDPIAATCARNLEHEVPTIPLSCAAASRKDIPVLASTLVTGARMCYAREKCLHIFTYT